MLSDSHQYALLLKDFKRPRGTRDSQLGNFPAFLKLDFNIVLGLDVSVACIRTVYGVIDMEAPDPGEQSLSHDHGHVAGLMFYLERYARPRNKMGNQVQLSF